MTPLTLPSQVTLESRVSRARVRWHRRAGLDLLRLLGHLRQRLRHRRAAREPHHPGPGHGRDRCRRRPGAAALPWPELRAQAAAGRLLEFLLPTPLTTVTPDAAAAVLDTGRASPAARPGAGRGGDLRPGPGPGQVHGRRHRGADRRPGGLGPGPGRMPGHGPRHGGAAARGRAARPVRLRATCTPTRRPSPARPRWARATPGWSTGPATGGRSTRPTAPRSGERHVVVARGRDYADVPPLKGIYHGAPASPRR